MMELLTPSSLQAAAAEITVSPVCSQKSAVGSTSPESILAAEISYSAAFSAEMLPQSTRENAHASLPHFTGRLPRF